jgi:phosphatidylglycerophosphatase A
MRRDRLALALASLAGLGYIPWASGTWATLAALPMIWLIRNWPLWLYAGLTGLCFMVGVWAADRAEAKLQENDSHKIVIDEWTGTMITMLLVPIRPSTLLAGFFLFRFFDIVKPGPIGWSQRLPGGLGIMMDDLLGGIAACLCLHGLIAFGIFPLAW